MVAWRRREERGVRFKFWGLIMVRNSCAGIFRLELAKFAVHNFQIVIRNFYPEIFYFELVKVTVHNFL
jgi:hypothetical protein